MYHVDIHFVGWSGRLRRVLKNIGSLPFRNVFLLVHIQTELNHQTFGFGGFAFYDFPSSTSQIEEKRIIELAGSSNVLFSSSPPNKNQWAACFLIKIGS